MKFTKMHGAGNDYVYVNCFVEQVPNPSETAIKVSNRNFGIGSDGLILIMPSDKADVRMRMFNSDGSESEMCGNGIRCVAKYAYDHGIVSKKDLEEGDHSRDRGRHSHPPALHQSGEQGRQGPGKHGETAPDTSRDPDDG
jgi:diaminopimelate epimerase